MAVTLALTFKEMLNTVDTFRIRLLKGKKMVLLEIYQKKSITVGAIHELPLLQKVTRL